VLLIFRQLREAAEAAFENKSEEELNRVARNCTDKADKGVTDLCQSYKQQLGGRR